VSLDPIPTVKLSNGVVVGNFSLPHSLTFTDGSILPACSEARADALILTPEEREFQGIKGTRDVYATFKMTEEVRAEMHRQEANRNVDILIVSLLVMETLEDFGWSMRISKARVARVADNGYFHDRFGASRRTIIGRIGGDHV
jgi:hypothetical protein